MSDCPSNIDDEGRKEVQIKKAKRISKSPVRVEELCILLSWTNTAIGLQTFTFVQSQGLKVWYKDLIEAIKV